MPVARMTRPEPTPERAGPPRRTLTVLALGVALLHLLALLLITRTLDWQLQPPTATAPLHTRMITPAPVTAPTPPVTRPVTRPLAPLPAPARTRSSRRTCMTSRTSSAPTGACWTSSWSWPRSAAPVITPGPRSPPTSRSALPSLLVYLGIGVAMGQDGIGGRSQLWPGVGAAVAEIQQTAAQEARNRWLIVVAVLLAGAVALLLVQTLR